MDSAPALIEHMLALRLMLAVVLLPASYSFVGTGLVPSAICVSARDNGCMALLQAFRVRVRTSDCRLFYQATPEARPDEVSFGAGLPREELDCDNDAEATHLWSKLPQSLRAGYQYVRVLGRGSFGIVVLVINVGIRAAQLRERGKSRRRRRRGRRGIVAVWKRNGPLKGQR